jgi:hypothetical protein
MEMNFEETIRLVLREELERSESRIAARVAERVQSPASVSGDRLLRPTDVRQMFGYAPETVRKWVAARKLTRFGTARSTRVSERELRAFLATRKTDGELSEEEILTIARERAARR